jgi:hypothetical protein
MYEDRRAISIELVEGHLEPHIAKPRITVAGEEADAIRF